MTYSGTKITRKRKPVSADEHSLCTILFISTYMTATKLLRLSFRVSGSGFEPLNAILSSLQAAPEYPKT
jgi:hypothetical protein